MIIVKPVVTRKEWNAFFAFPNNLYKGNKYFVPYLIADEKDTFSPKKNPAHEYCDTRLFLAYKDKKVVGRIAGLINNKLNAMKGMKQMRFTRWDVIDDIEVSKALFEAVFAWGKAKGMTEIIGPIGFSDLDKQGLLVEGFDQVGMFITLYNHPYYHEHLTKLGFVKDVDWIEYTVYTPKELIPRVKRISEMAQERHGYRLLEFTRKKEIIPYAKEIFHMYNESYAHLYGFCPLTDGQIEMAVDQFFMVAQLDYIYVVVDKEDAVIGFGLLIPSLSKAMQKSNGRLFPTGLFRILRSLKRYDVLDMYLIAVKPEYFGRGVNAVILHEGIKKAIEHNVVYAKTGPMLETNTYIRTQWRIFETEQNKRRRCFKQVFK